MTKLLEIKDKIVKFYSNYEIYVNIVFKFIVAFDSVSYIILFIASPNMYVLLTPSES